jgi:hypothetical protein
MWFPQSSDFGISMCLHWQYDYLTPATTVLAISPSFTASCYRDNVLCCFGWLQSWCIFITVSHPNIYLIFTDGVLSSRLAAINSRSNGPILEAASRHEANQMFVDAFMTDRVQRLS